MASKMSDYQAALKHKYRVESGGEYVPGVTSVIGIMDKPALKWASSRIAAVSLVELDPKRRAEIVIEHRAQLAKPAGRSESAQKKRILADEGSDDEVLIHWARGEFDRQWRAKANRGNRVHDVAEAWTRGESVDVLDEDNGFVDSLELFHKNYSPTFDLAECVVLNADLKYGGRFDAVTSMEGPGTPAGRYLIDYKTGGEYPWDCAMQSEGYRHGRLGVYDDEGTLTGFEDLPEIDGARTIYLRVDGSLSVKDPFAIISQDDAWEAFKAARALYEINKRVEKALEQGEPA
jgi:hypothetical protein